MRAPHFFYLLGGKRNWMTVITDHELSQKMLVVDWARWRFNPQRNVIALNTESVNLPLIRHCFIIESGFRLVCNNTNKLTDNTERNLLTISQYHAYTWCFVLKPPTDVGASYFKNIFLHSNVSKFVTKIMDNLKCDKRFIKFLLGASTERGKWYL